MDILELGSVNKITDIDKAKAYERELIGTKLIRSLP